MRAALYDETAAIAEVSAPTSGATAADIVRQVASLVRMLADDAESERLDAIGLGVPGVIHDGVLRLAPNLPSFDGVDVEHALADAFSTEVVVGNDVNMATLGELRHGRGQGVDSFVFLAVGTGLGLGIVVDGKLVEGMHGAAGEIGALPFGGATLEDVAGGAALVRAFAAAESARDVYAAAERGDDAARSALEAHIAGLAHAVRIAQALLDPELVVIGGGIGSRDDLVPRVREALAEHAVHVRVERSALGTDAGVVGAAEAARRIAKERVGA